MATNGRRPSSRRRRILLCLKEGPQIATIGRSLGTRRRPEFGVISRSALRNHGNRNAGVFNQFKAGAPKKSA